MVKLLIADRDQNERNGINWLISSYSLPYKKVLLAESVEETIHLAEQELPDAVCIEIDMIPLEQWERVKKAIQLYSGEVIVATAEATFERAMQAIELNAFDLWVKPLSPDEIKRTLQHCHRQIVKGQEKNSAPNVPVQSGLTYQSLFINEETAGGPYAVLLIQTENVNDLVRLQNFIEVYPFQHNPTIFPLSDMVACVFDVQNDVRKKEYVIQVRQRLLKQWENQSHEPIAGVLYIPKSNQTPHESYVYAKQLLQIHFFKGYRQLTLIREEISWQMIDPFLTSDEQKDWIEMLNEGSYERIKEWMYNEFLSFEMPYPDPGLLRTRLSSILAQVRRFMKSHYLQYEKLEDHYHRIFETILYTPVLYRIVQDFILFINEVIKGSKEHQNNKIFDVTERAVLFMENNFADKDLSLNKVAAYVDRSPAYLSSLFTTKKGSSFRQILTEIRIKAAEGYLLSSDLSIQEIAHKTGYRNANYFSRIFKEMVGISPRSYKNSKNL
ncbi:helix-turn-helix domain-containing protein [Bacillus sp. P14.5]|uniref:helix-turn-helix domain-containing protein n=1 Tax=Bacillus sp. P14.5 TaxID=1983400 RepID=UPI000DE913AD|nr:helix-turn-helix domain-containing protein [Bacillus sp. P14.5]